jgi:hypothetical protein
MQASHATGQFFIYLSAEITNSLKKGSIINSSFITSAFKHVYTYGLSKMISSPIISHFFFFFKTTITILPQQTTMKELGLFLHHQWLHSLDFFFPS